MVTATAFEAAVEGLGFEIENLDTVHATTMLAIETATEDEQCFKRAYGLTVRRVNVSIKDQ